MKKQNIPSLSFLLLSALFLQASCKSAKITSTGFNEDNTVKYLSSVIESEPFSNPDRAYYRQFISVQEIAACRQLLWNAWKKANITRLTTWPGIQENAYKDSCLWNLPTGKKALFEVLKKGNRPAGGYPMFINLHGGGTMPEAENIWGAAFNNSEWLAAKRLGLLYADSPSLYFIPRMADDRRGRWYHKGEQTEFIRAWQLAVLAGDADPDKIYILGISEGGYGSFRMGPFLADYFAGAGPMAGVSFIHETALENLRNTPFDISVGEYDAAYGRAAAGWQWKHALDSASAANPGQFIHQVNIEKGMGHGIPYNKTSPWLRQFVRNVYPDTLSFQYYAVHDTVFNRKYDTSYTYRKGFGYVRLDGLSHSVEKEPDGLLKTGVRDFYIEKKGNVYRLISSNRIGTVSGFVDLYLDKVDFSIPVTIYYNGKMVFKDLVKPNRGTMMESLALFGDPERIFTAKIHIKI